jgi:hypothetical protein
VQVNSNILTGYRVPDTALVAAPLLDIPEVRVADVLMASINAPPPVLNAVQSTYKCDATRPSCVPGLRNMLSVSADCPR